MLNGVMMYVCDVAKLTCVVVMPVDLHHSLGSAGTKARQAATVCLCPTTRVLEAACA